MGLRFKSFRRGNIIGLTMIYPDGRCCNVMFAEVPVDGDWRADVDFYDDIETAYKKRTPQSPSKLNTIQHMQKHYHSGSAFLLSITT